jgi:MFS family permease
MVGCWLVSAYRADSSVKSQGIGAIIWLTVSAFTFLLPSVDPPASAQRLTWKQRLGWDALVLFKNPDHRVVFIATVLFSIPMAAFYAFTPPHLQQLGFQRVAAWMTLGQVMEITGLLALGGLLMRWRLKWIFLIALGAGVPRFFLCATDSKAGLLAGILLHGLCYALFFVTAQIYLDERVESAWRGRAQALFSLMNNGVGNLAGYLGTGWWFNACAEPTGMRWPLFWGGLGVVTVGVAIYFLCAYHGIGPGARAAEIKSFAAEETTK